ncbi:MAG: penicillin-binding protein 2 [Patescibacteria group bacterium]|nr:penicillin-binding protein 2 [Patescibacteria group bacterium]
MKNWRINFIFILFLFVSGAVTGRLVSLQILEGDLNKALSQGLFASFENFQADRGEIFLKNKEALAINIDLPFIFVNPKKIQDIEKTAQVFSEILGLEKDFILEKLTINSSYSLIKKKLTKEEAQKITDLDLEGVFLSEQKERYYPQIGLASQVIGFLSAEGTGQYGLEQFYDEALQGKIGLDQDKKGDDLVLTIDYNIQYEAERLLEKVKKDLDAEKGQIIVIEPYSGRILAMADVDNFDPNYYQQYAGDLAVFKNRSTQALFEPGSVFKPITMAAALEEEKVTPKTTYTDTGSITIGSDTIYNYNKRIYEHEPTMTEVLEKSINTGAIFVQRELGPNLFLKYVDKFGFFEPTKIDIQEVYSQNNELRTARDINLATASFGQGIEMTPIQLVRAYCAIANGGKLINPYLVESSISSDKEIKNHAETEQEQIISSKTASQVTAMLVSVVENGFAQSAKIPGYFVAGKTGTAQVAYSALGVKKSGYSDKTIQTFIGFAPAFNPKFLVMVKLDNPKTRTAEYSTIPVFKDLADYIINYYQIPPDYE